MSTPPCRHCGSTRAKLDAGACANAEHCWRRQCARRVEASDKARRELNVGQCPRGLKTYRGNSLHILCCLLHAGHEGRHLNGAREW